MRRLIRGLRVWRVQWRWWRARSPVRWWTRPPTRPSLIAYMNTTGCDRHWRAESSSRGSVFYVFGGRSVGRAFGTCSALDFPTDGRSSFRTLVFWAPYGGGG